MAPVSTLPSASGSGGRPAAAGDDASRQVAAPVAVAVLTKIGPGRAASGPSDLRIARSPYRPNDNAVADPLPILPVP